MSVLRRPFTLVGLLAASGACEGYAGGAPYDRARDRSAEELLPPPAAPITDEPEREQEADDEASDGAAPDHIGPEASAEPPYANLRLARTRRFDGYLVDAAGRTLYMFAGDVAGAADSACLGECRAEWPPFDLPELLAGPGIDPAHVARFHRQDGPWQLAYKGFPLYYRAAEEGTRATDGDGLYGHWFVARDYLAFVAARSAHASAGPLGVETYLTDGFGRTLYVCLDDAPRTATSAPKSSCVGGCSVDRPPWNAAATLRASALPSALSAGALGSFVRDDGSVQLTYGGWPLYFFRGDVQLGGSVGHNQRAWRALDPTEPLELP